jgi:uncharacterized membrane protein
VSISDETSTSGSRDNLPGVERLLALTDGVVAIALTLLVFQLKIPSHLADARSASQLADQLGRTAGQLISYGISFYVIAQFWLAHHRVFRLVAGHQEGLAWWNFAFLLTITLMPFTSNLLGAYGTNPLAVDIFAANLLLASLTSQATIFYGRRRGLLVTKGDAGTALLREMRTRGVLMALIIAASLGLAWVDTGAAEYCWLLMIAAPRAAARWSAHRDRPGPDAGDAA